MARRGVRYVYERAKFLLRRYQISPSNATRRIDTCLERLVDQGCAPTFPTPGIIVNRYPQYFRHLQAIGAEIAVHGYHHVDLRAYPVNEAYQQLVKAVEVFKKRGIEVHGFRCPYTGYSDELLEALPEGLFEYSSNQTIYWDTLKHKDNLPDNLVVDILHNLYQAKSSNDFISLPRKQPNMVEIPVCLPDDMELLDGMKFGPDEVANVWHEILIKTHQRGELFNLIFHPELASLCDQPFFDILNWAKLLQPQVWVARLRDISEWWAQKSNFQVKTTETSTNLRLDFCCSSRATILAKGLDLRNSGSIWDGEYHRIHSTTLEIPASPRPFLGLSPETPQKVVSFLQEQGYLLDTSETASKCSIYLNEIKLKSLKSETEIIDAVEACPGPLVRYWRWPDGAKSALSITGDLDALTLLDYASRLFV